MENQNTQILADKISRLLQTEMQTSELNSLQSNLEKIAQRLENIELKLSAQETQTNLSALKPFHFSQEKFTDLDEVADEIISNFQTEKACPYEPTGKPCDQCAMCNSRGF